MAYNYEYPYVDSQDYNDDWLLHAMQEYKAEWSKILEEITNKWVEYQEQIDQFKEQVNQEIANFENSLTQQWTQYQQETNQSLDQFKNALTEQWSDVEQEWQDYKKTLTADWTAYQQTQSQLWQEFKTGIEATQDAFRTEVLADISTLESAWATYKTTVNNALSAQDTKIAEYKAYMDNYFSNLDLTTEISNKIDGMVSDGTMDTIINTEVFNGLNAKIGGLYKANSLQIMIGDKLNTYNPGGTTETIASVFRRVLGLTENQMFSYLATTTSFWLDDNGDGVCDGITMLQIIASKMTTQQVLNVSDIYLISAGSFCGVDAHVNALSSMLRQLYGYIKSTFLNATPHILCTLLPNKNKEVRDCRLRLYRLLLNNTYYGTCHNVYQIFYNKTYFSHTNEFTTIGMELMAHNIYQVAHGGELSLGTATPIKLRRGVSSAQLKVIPEKEGLRITSTGLSITNASGQLTTTSAAGVCIIGDIDSQSVNTYYPVSMALSCALNISNTSAGESVMISGALNVVEKTTGAQELQFFPLKSSFNFAGFNAFNITVNGVVPWSIF